MSKKQSGIVPIILPSAEDLANTPPSVVALISALQDEIARLRLRIEELEARLNNDSSNSNKPPSSDLPYKKPASQSKKAKRKTRTGVRQQMLEPSEVIDCLPSACKCGCQDFEDVTEYYCHQHLEIPTPTLQVTHFVLHRGYCFECGATVKAHIPDEFRAGFGVYVHALIVELCGMHGMSREAVQTLLKSVYSLAISQGAIQKCLDRASEAVQPHYEAIKEAAHCAEVNYIDETTWRRFGHTGAALQWLWVMVSGKVAYFSITQKRNKDAFLALIGDWKGILVSDGYGVYRKWDGEARQTCLAHLIRAAQKLKESVKAEIASCGTWIKAELVRLCRMNRHLPTFGEVSALFMRLGRFVQKYEHRKDAVGTFSRRIAREMPHLKVFREHVDVDPTNNLAERSLRYGVLWRKRSNGTTSEKGERFVERMLSLRHTCRLQGRSTFAMLHEICTAHAKRVLQNTGWVTAERLTL